MGIEIIGKLTQKNNGDFKLVDLENVDYDGTGKNAKQELEKKIEEAKNSSDTTAIKADIQTLKDNAINLIEDETSMEGIKDNEYPSLTTQDKTLIGSINEVNSQYKDIVNLNFIDHGGDKTGLVDNSKILENIINSFSDEILITLPKGIYLISENITIPSNISFKFNMGAIIKIATNKKVVINGKIFAGNYTIFDGEGIADIHLSSTPIVLSWYSGDSFNIKWNKIKQTLESWRNYELIVPKPYPNQEGAKQLSDNDINWWVWKLTEPWVLDDKCNQAIINMYGELSCDGIVSAGLVIDDVEKPENILFPLGITIRGVNNTDNYFTTGIEIRGTARLIFNGKVDIQYCDYGLVVGGSNQKREVGQMYFDYLHIAFIKTRHIILDGNKMQIIGNRFRDVVLERVINDNQDCISVKGNCKNNIFDCIQYLTGTDNDDTTESAKDARNIIVLQSTNTGHPVANEIRKIYATNITGCGIKIEDLSNGTESKVEDTIIGYINCDGGTGIDINYCKGTKVTCASNGAMTHRIRSNSEYTSMNIGNRSGKITDEGSFTIINNFVNVGKVNELPNTVGSKIGNLVCCDKKIYLRISETGTASNDFILLSNI